MLVVRRRTCVDTGSYANRSGPDGAFDDARESRAAGCAAGNSPAIARMRSRPTGAHAPRAMIGAIAVGLASQSNGRQRSAAANERRHVGVDLRQEAEVEARLRVLAQVRPPGRLEQRAAHQARLVELATARRPRSARVTIGSMLHAAASTAATEPSAGASERPGRRHRRDRVAARRVGEVVRRRARGNERRAVAEPVRLDQRRRSGPRHLRRDRRRQRPTTS